MSSDVNKLLLNRNPDNHYLMFIVNVDEYEKIRSELENTENK